MNIDDNVRRHQHSFDKPFQGRLQTPLEHIEVMWHMAEASIRCLLALVEDPSSDSDDREVAIFLARCWMKDYEELDRRRRAEITKEECEE